MTLQPEDPLTAPFNVAHANSDEDLNPDAIHHTLGQGPTQAAPGNHVTHAIASKEAVTNSVTTITNVEKMITGLNDLQVDVPVTPSGSLKYDIFMAVSWVATGGFVGEEFVLRDGGSSAPTISSSELERQPTFSSPLGYAIPSTFLYIASVILTAGRHRLGISVDPTTYGGTSVDIGSATYKSHLRATPIGVA